MADAPAWYAKGQWFDVCKCSVPCPCSWAQAPSFGDCDGILVWHIDEGRFGDVVLDGLNVAGLGHFQGNVWAGEHSDAKIGIFLDERADESQREALGAIFGGHAGGWPQQFNELLGGEMLGLEFVPISVDIAPDLSRWEAEVAGKFTAKAEALKGPTTPEGARVQVHNLPGSETGPGQVATWGVATADTVDAFGLKWDWAGRSAKHIPFDWSGP